MLCITWHHMPQLKSKFTFFRMNFFNTGKYCPQITYIFSKTIGRASKNQNYLNAEPYCLFINSQVLTSSDLSLWNVCFYTSILLLLLSPMFPVLTNRKPSSVCGLKRSSGITLSFINVVYSLPLPLRGSDTDFTCIILNSRCVHGNYQTIT